MAAPTVLAKDGVGLAGFLVGESIEIRKAQFYGSSDTSVGGLLI